MKKIVTALSLIFSSFLLLSSCKKDTPAKEAVTIVGKWTLTETGTDLNQNGRLDASETSAISGYIETIDFKADKSVEIVYKNDNYIDTDKGTYSYENNRLSIIFNGGTDEADVLSLTKDILTLRFNADSPATFFVYKK